MNERDVDIFIMMAGYSVTSIYIYSLSSNKLTSFILTLKINLFHIIYTLYVFMFALFKMVAQTVKYLPAIQKTWV